MGRRTSVGVLLLALVVGAGAGYVVVAGCALGSVGTLGQPSSCDLTGGNLVLVLLAAVAVLAAITSAVSLLRRR